jgi:hypothetical protein
MSRQATAGLADHAGELHDRAARLVPSAPRLRWYWVLTVPVVMATITGGGREAP